MESKSPINIVISRLWDVKKEGGDDDEEVEEWEEEEEGRRRAVFCPRVVVFFGGVLISTLDIFVYIVYNTVKEPHYKDPVTQTVCEFEIMWMFSF